MFFWDTKLPYVNPSPNLPTQEGCFTFIGTVLFEGTNISEGRGTTRALEQIGHPRLDSWALKEHFEKVFKQCNLDGFTLRAVNFHPMFQKHEHLTCGGYFIHPTDFKKFTPWKFAQVFLKEFRRLFPDDFHYNTNSYEYGESLQPIDMINGTDKLRTWYESPKLNYSYLNELEQNGREQYLAQLESIKIYK